MFASEGIEIVRTPYRTPNATAYAETWLLTIREESLQHPLIISERHLRPVPRESISYYNHHRAHRGIGRQIPVGLAKEAACLSAPVCRWEALGGILALIKLPY